MYRPLFLRGLPADWLPTISNPKDRPTRLIFFKIVQRTKKEKMINLFFLLLAASSRCIITLVTTMDCSEDFPSFPYRVPSCQDLPSYHAASSFHDPSFPYQDLPSFPSKDALLPSLPSRTLVG